MLGMFALVYARELPDASSLMAEGFRQALVLDRSMLAGIAHRLLNPPVDNAEVLPASVPRRVPHLVDLSRLLERRGRPAAAAAAFETALAIASEPAEGAEVRLAHGQVLLRRKDVGRALAELRQALVLAPKSPDVFAALGEAYEAAEQWAEAESAHASAVILAKVSTPGQVNSSHTGPGWLDTSHAGAGLTGLSRSDVRSSPRRRRIPGPTLLARIGRREQAIEQRSVGIAVLDAAPRP
jgi:tetratricopeptide (TPR) repeat protein